MSSTTLAQRLKRIIAEALDDAKAPSPAPKPNSAPATSSASSEKDEKLASGDVETKDVVGVLNGIRAGRSFRDSAVAGPMEKYIDKLDAAEKTALYAFLSGLAQIVSGQVPGETATEPSDPPADVSMKKQAASQPKAARTKSVKPNVVGGKQAQPAAQPTGSKSKSSIEDTTAPAPIVPRAR